MPYRSVDFSWFKDNAWIASWLNVILFATLDVTIFYYIYTFLGRLSPTQRRNLSWRMRSLGTLSEADRARMEVENESGS